jgi:hypothetical protein
MIDPKCDVCGKELMEPGAILYGPPEDISKIEGVERMYSRKEHICQRCYRDLRNIIDNIK